MQMFLGEVLNSRAMGTVHVDPEERRRAFGRALRDAVNRSTLSREDLGERIGSAPNTISDWMTGKKEPKPATVFAVETALGLAPGQLSLHLGYLPPEAAESSLEAAIRATPGLDENQRRAILAFLRELIRPDESDASRPQTG